MGKKKTQAVQLAETMKPKIERFLFCSWRGYEDGPGKGSVRGKLVPRSCHQPNNQEDKLKIRMTSFLWGFSFSTNSSLHPYSNFISDFLLQGSLLSQFKRTKFIVNLYKKTAEALGASRSENLERTKLHSAQRPNQINYIFVPVPFGNILDFTCTHTHTHIQIRKF